MRDFEELERSKNKSDDRLLKLKVIDGKKPLSGTGLVDPRLFTGENDLHLFKDPRDNLWSFRYDRGTIPGALNQKFTSYAKAMSFVTVYLKTRNLEVYEVID